MHLYETLPCDRENWREHDRRAEARHGPTRPIQVNSAFSAFSAFIVCIFPPVSRESRKFPERQALCNGRVTRASGGPEGWKNFSAPTLPDRALLPQSQGSAVPAYEVIQVNLSLSTLQVSKI